MMRGSIVDKVPTARTLIKRLDPAVARGRAMSVWIPKKSEKEGTMGGEETPESPIAKAVDMEPITVFSRPPPLPPVLGPLVVFSLLEMALNRDKQDN